METTFKKENKMWQYGYSSSHSRSYQSSPAPVKQTKFKITLFSAMGTIINSWTGTSIRQDNGVCKFYNEKTGTLVQIVGTIVVE